MMCPANAVSNVDLTINFASNGTVSMKFNTSTGVNDVFLQLLLCNFIQRMSVTRFETYSRCLVSALIDRVPVYQSFIPKWTRLDYFHLVYFLVILSYGLEADI